MPLDVLLIQPPMPECKRFPLDLEGVVPPMTLMALASPLLEKGFSVDILDLSSYNINPQRFKDYLQINRPVVVGITCITVTFSNALKAAKYVKQVDPNIKVVIGGPHVTFTAKETVENDCIDIVVRGEGDINFPRLVEHYLCGKYSLAEIDGISFLRDGKFQETPRKAITDIDALPLPAREIIDLSRYDIPGVIQTSRGCPFECHFCAVGAFFEGKYRVRSVAHILEEIDDVVMKKGIQHLAFLDDTLTARPAITKALCRHILEKDYKIKWFCESRVDTVNKELIELMAQAGCYWVQFGFESGSDKILNAVDKKITSRQIITANEICLDSGIFPTGNFLIGFPEDTRETVQETIALAKEISRKGSYVAVGVVTPLPGTYYYNHARELGITIHAEEWDDFEMGYPLISTKNFTREELREIMFDMLLELDGLNPANKKIPGLF